MSIGTRMTRIVDESSTITDESFNDYHLAAKFLTRLDDFATEKLEELFQDFINTVPEFYRLNIDNMTEISEELNLMLAIDHEASVSLNDVIENEGDRPTDLEFVVERAMMEDDFESIEMQAVLHRGDARTELIADLRAEILENLN